MFPILLDDKVVAYSSPQGEPNYSDLDLGYLSAMRESLVLGTTVGLTLTLLLGLFLGNRLSSSLRNLTGAVQAMGEGALRQQVPVESENEVGVLARAFNRMSDEIARQYEDLRQSHAQIEAMATQMRELSLRDVLTGLHNRRHFDEQCAQFFASAQRYQRAALPAPLQRHAVRHRPLQGCQRPLFPRHGRRGAAPPGRHPEAKHAQLGLGGTVRG